MTKRFSVFKSEITGLFVVNDNTHEFAFEGVEDAGMAVETGATLEYSPNPNAVFDYLIDTYLNAILYGAMVEAYQSEQTARLTAMQNATENADEMMKKLTLMSNRARQAKITTELTEIVNGAEQVDKI